MGSDGANLGIRAGRALNTILGDKPQPEEDERMSNEELEALIRSRPLPGDGPKPFERSEGKGAGMDGYSFAAECLAHAFLVLVDEDPELLTKELFYDEAYISTLREENQPYFREHMLGKPRERVDAVWDAFKERWPDGDDWIGGPTGFMVGWAFNAVRTIKELPPAPNPAIMTVGTQPKE